MTKELQITAQKPPQTPQADTLFYLVMIITRDEPAFVTHPDKIPSWVERNPGKYVSWQYIEVS